MALKPEDAKTQYPNADDQKRVTSFRNTKGGTGAYNIQQRCYPLEISTDPDKLHYVTFFINVRGKSKIMKNGKTQIIGEVTNAGENRVDSRKLGMATGAAYGIGLGAVAGLSVGNTVRQAVYARVVGKGGGVVAGAIAGTAAQLATGVAASAAAGLAGAGIGELLIKPDTTYRISDAITLHISTPPSVQYSADYDNVELGTLIGGIASGLSAKDTMEHLKVAGPEAIRALMLKAAAIPGNLVSAGAVGNGIGVGSKQNLNPYREVLFQSIGFRKFAFDYTFMPRSREESENVHNIIKTFKYHMHPELSEGGLYYIHPSEFQIQYYFNGKENTYFNKISTCVLEDMNVDYGTETLSTFKDGAPTEIRMRLVFRELETLTKDRVEEGF